MQIIKINFVKINIMKRILLAISIVALLLTSCGAKKKIADLESKNKEIQDLLNTCTVKLNTCITEKDGLSSQLDYLKKSNTDLLNNMNNMTTLSTKGHKILKKH